MNRHDMSWSQINHKVRMRFGLRWKGSRPCIEDYFEAVIYLVAAALIAVSLLAIWSALDARDARITAEIQGDKASRQFADFLNGAALTNPEQTIAVKCERLLTVTN